MHIQCVFRKSEADQLRFQEIFQEKLLAAREKAKVGRHKSKHRLKEAPIVQSDVDIWFERSFIATGLLMNGHVERQRTMTLIRGTCVVDSILQALTWQYIDNDKFRRVVDERNQMLPDADLTRFMAASAQGGFIKKSYRWRRDLASEYCYTSIKGDIKIIECTSWVLELLAGFVAPTFPTMTSRTVCKCKTRRIFVTLPINVPSVLSSGVAVLQSAIDNRIHCKKILCKRCGQKRVEKHVFGDIVFILVGDHKVTPRYIENLDEIPSTIFLKDRKYNLTCFFDLIQPGHLKLNCIRKVGEWYQYDDNETTAKPLLGKTFPYILMYRKGA